MELELINYLDKKFSKLDGRMDKLDGRMDKLDGRMDKLDGRMDKLDGRMDKLDGRMDKLDGRMDRVEGEVRKNREAIRHTNIVVEDLRGQIQLVAEGVTAVRERQDLDREQNAREHQELRNLIEVRYTDLDRRVTHLEGH